MKRLTILCAAWILVILTAAGVNAQFSFEQILRGAREAVTGKETLSEDRIAAGLKEALTVGTRNAVSLVSAVNGYYGNPEIKIPIPAAVRRVETVLRTVGFGQTLDEFELSMNRAAEAAAPAARDLFVDAITGMTVTDAKKIFHGRENEATVYFEEKTRNRLQEIFKPIVSNAMASVGVTRSYQELDAKLRTIPFADAVSLDLDGYVTDGALDGLFLTLAREERRIRENPAARVTDLLREVFGAK